MKEKYTSEIAPALMKKFHYKSVMQIPKLDKIIVNVGCGESKNNAKEIEAICKDIATITGQKPITTKARKSVANFKVREGETVGVKVTLRATRCMSSWTGCSAWRCLGSATSGASTPIPLTAAATMPSAEGTADLPGDRVRQGG